MEAELKPCPFCGGVADLINTNSDNWVVCKNRSGCGCALGRYRTVEQAVAAWNERPGEEKSNEK